MPHLLLHDMDTAWISSDPLVLAVEADHGVFCDEGPASNRLTAVPGAVNAFAELVPAVPLDLRLFDELRFWVRTDRAAAGSSTRPFYLMFSYTDAGDIPGEEHRWYVSVNRAGVWEQRRIGIESDRRESVNRFRLECLTDLPFVCHVDELLAVREEMPADIEEALEAQIDGQTALPGLSNVVLNQNANPGGTQIVLPLAPGFNAGNRVVVRGGSAGDERHQVVSVSHDAMAGATTLHFAPSDPVMGTLAAGVATASVMAPILFENPPPAAPLWTTPAVIVTHLDMREDLERTGYFTQQDSFRPRGAFTTVSVRPAPRAYLLEYQITVTAPDRAQQLFIHHHILQKLSMDLGLRVNGTLSPVWILPPPALDRRKLGVPAPVYVRIGTRMETARRQEQTWVRRAELEAGRMDAPLEREGITLIL